MSLNKIITENINSVNKNFEFYIRHISKNEISLLINKINKVKNEGIIYISGVGKSENIAINFCNLLKSISIKSFYLNILNSLHGDIGTINEHDLIIFLSNSGNTKEILNIIPNLKKEKCFIASIICKNDSKLELKSDLVIKLKYINELPNSLNLIPTNSSMIQLITCNIITSCLANIDANKYKLNHEKGNIGNNLKNKRYNNL